VLPTDQTSYPLHPLQHELSEARSVGLAIHRLHDGIGHGSVSLHFAVANLLEHVRLLRESRIDRGDEGSVVRDDLQASGRDDLSRRALPRDDTLDHLAGESVVQGTRLDERHHLGHVG